MTGAKLRRAVGPVTGAPPRSAETSTRRPRLVAVDAARGVALLGMIAVHSLYVVDEDGRPTWSGVIFSGRAAAAFAVLAGVGIAFMTGRRRVHLSTALPTAAALTVRALLVGAIGLALGYTNADLGAVILPYYAVMFLLAIPLVLLPTWTIAALGLATAVGMPALSHLLRPHLPNPTLTNPTFGHLVNDPAGLLTELSLTGFYPALPWLAYLCTGLVIGRLDLTSKRTAATLLATGTALAITTAATSTLLLHHYRGLDHIHANSGLTPKETTELLTLGGNGTTPTTTWWWLATNAPHTSTPPDLLGTTGTAIALLGALLLASRPTRPLLRGLTTLTLTPLAAAGSMTLTLYTAHIVFINSDYDTYDATTGYLIQATTALLVGLCWRAAVGRGPLEGMVSVLAAHARQRWARATLRPAPKLPEQQRHDR
jgi:uncharacterized membrane protein